MVPTIGASGAISGVLGAYIVLYPSARVYTYIFPFGILMIPAIFFLGFWFLLQVISTSYLLIGGAPSGVAYWAHIGGFVAGALMIYPLVKSRGGQRNL
jgi:membrane associated rhomboid family serine protease